MQILLIFGLIYLIISIIETIESSANRCETQISSYENCMRDRYGHDDSFKLDGEIGISANEFDWEMDQCFLNHGCTSPFVSELMTLPDKPYFWRNASVQLNDKRGPTVRIDLKSIPNSDRVIAECGSSIVNGIFRQQISDCLRKYLKLSKDFQLLPEIGAKELRENVDLEFPKLASGTVEDRIELLRHIHETTNLMMKRAGEKRYCEVPVQTQKNVAQCARNVLYKAETKIDPTPLRTARNKRNGFCAAKARCTRRLSKPCHQIRARIQTDLAKCLTADMLVKIYSAGQNSYYECLMRRGFPRFNPEQSFFSHRQNKHFVLGRKIQTDFQDFVKHFLASFALFHKEDSAKLWRDVCHRDFVLLNFRGKMEAWKHFRFEKEKFGYPMVVSVPKYAQIFDPSYTATTTETTKIPWVLHNATFTRHLIGAPPPPPVTVKTRRRQKRQAASIVCQLVDELKTSLAILHSRCAISDPKNCYNTASISTDHQVEQLDERTILALIEGGFTTQVKFVLYEAEMQLISRLSKPFRSYIYLLFAKLPRYTRLTKWGHE